MNAASSDAPASPQKFLRYRSVRRAKPATEDAERQSPPPPLPQTAQTSLTRVPSRYHRRHNPEEQTCPVPPVPAVLPVRDPPPTLRTEHPPARNHNADESDREASGREEIIESGRRREAVKHGHSPNVKATGSRETSRRQPASPKSSPPEKPRRSYEAAREEARLILEGEGDRLRALRRQEAKRQQEDRERRERQREHKLAAETQSRATEAKAEEEKTAQKRENPVLGVDSTRSRTAQETSSELPKRSRTLAIGGPRPQSYEKAKTRLRTPPASEEQRVPQRRLSRNIGAGRVEETPKALPSRGKPNFDAPVSAVNAGDRRVSVKCKETLITLPVTPSTTCKDVLNSAATCISEPIDPRTAVLVESFSQLGLERPLRRYERIRDVMNSWDTDEQHHLLIMTASECATLGLQETEAPRHQPSGTSVQLYHSQKPGKWDKRWLRLREDGQVTISKNEHGLDATKICHVSDFDVYTPTAKQMRKLKPPKKLCFALKSQEKSAMFLEGTNFVHFFCTKEKETADGWYRAVHSWRSWYLVNMLGEGQQKPTEPASASVSASRLLQSQPAGSRPGARSSRDSAPYMQGSLKPLLDFSPSRSSVEGVVRKPEFEALLSRRPSPGDNVAARPLVDFTSSSSERPSTTIASNPPSSPKRPPRTGGGGGGGAPPNAFPRRLLNFDSPTATMATGISTACPTTYDVAAESSLTAASPFSSTGLIARSASRRSQAGAGIRSAGGRGGRAVGADGKPLLDMTPTSEFTDGSLLQKIEAMSPAASSEPRIDRQKRREINVSVGEGFG